MTNQSHASKLWWIVPRKLAGMPKPAPDDLPDLRQAGIRGIVSLLEDQTGLDEYRNRGFNTLWLPVPDDGTPTLDQVKTLEEFIDKEAGRDHPVAIHCVGGRGRTGTLLATYLISKGASYNEAMARIDEAQPNAIRKDFQKDFLRLLAAEFD